MSALIPNTFPDFWEQYGYAILVFGGWLIAGVVLDQLLATFIRKRATKSGSRIARAFALSFHGLIGAMAAVTGFWIAYLKTPLPSKVNRDISVYLKIATIIIVVAFIARVTGRLITVYSSRDDTRLPSSSLFGNLAKVVVWMIGLAGILSVLGISVTPIITALGVGGLAVGLALQSTLDNLFSGIQILASGQIVPGDFVRLESGEEGTVEDVTWRNTTVRRFSGEVIIVPNSVLGKSLIVNFSRSNKAFILVIPTTVAYNSDTEEVEKIALSLADKIMHESPYTYKGAQASVKFAKSDASGITFNTIIPIVSYTEQADVKSNYVGLLQKALVEAGIEGPIPVRQL